MVVLDDIRRPAQSLFRRALGVAEVAVDPLAEFVTRQKELADQMEAWARLQHDLADQMIAWAELQRRLAMAMEVWLAPAEGAAQLTTRALHAMTDHPAERSEQQLSGPT